MSSFKSYLQSKGFSKATISLYYKQALEFISYLDKQGMEVENATHRDIMAYIHHVKQRNISQGTAQKMVNVIKHFFNYHLEENQREDNPARHIKLQGIKRNTLHRILTHEELEALYSSYKIAEEKKTKSVNDGCFKPCPLTHQKHKTILSLYIYQGITSTDLKNLREKDILLTEGKIHLCGGRKHNARTLELKPQQVMVFMDYLYNTRKALLKNRQIPTDRLFTGARGGNRLDNTVYRMVKHLQQINPRVSGVKQIRASVITHWLGQYNLRKVQQMAGHRYVSSTESYLVNRMEDLKEDIDKFHPLTSG